MPTKEQMEELISLLNKWVNDYNGVKGLNGRLFTGTNGNTLFIPAAGYHFGPRDFGHGSYCNIWSSCIYKYSRYAGTLCFDPSSMGYRRGGRSNGYSVRPVLY